MNDRSGWHRLSKVFTVIVGDLPAPAALRHRGPVKSARSPLAVPTDFVAQMDDWPQSWAGLPDDQRIGAGLLIPMRDFLTHLAGQGVARSTVRRHFHGLWVIGGEIIRDVNDDESLRGQSPAQLLLNAIEYGQAPLLSGVSEADQRGFDTTARKLLRFLSATR